MTALAEAPHRRSVERGRPAKRTAALTSGGEPKATVNRGYFPPTVPHTTSRARLAVWVISLVSQAGSTSLGRRLILAAVTVPKRGVLGDGGQL